MDEALIFQYDIECSLEEPVCCIQGIYVQRVSVFCIYDFHSVSLGIYEFQTRGLVTFISINFNTIKASTPPLPFLFTQLRLQSPPLPLLFT